MSPRRSAAEAQATRGRILGRAAEIASEEGLEGITIGRLAEELDMSKSGVPGPRRPGSLYGRRLAASSSTKLTSS
ncbi:hypothetical protein ACWEWX_54280, partial [Streptomyces asiaticus]